MPKVTIELDTEQWAVVPRVPTEEMLRGLVGPRGYTSIPLVEAFSAMLAAAPRPVPADSDAIKSADIALKFIESGMCSVYPDVAQRHIYVLANIIKQPRPVPASERLAGGRILTCVYCGHEYPQDTPAHGSKVLTDHISQCEKHPMREVIDQRDKLKSALAGLIGASDSAELRNMELIIRLSPAPAADKAAMLDAIHVLLNVAEQPTGLTRPAEPDGGAA